MRASELRQPEVDSHILRFLGQSDRTVVEDGSVEGGMTQALLLMNGKWIEDTLLTTKALFMKDAQSAGGPDKQIESLYISVLSRPPTPSQQQAALTAMRSGLSLSDVAWSLLNSREFIFFQ
jgi:hypothetical protein